MSVNRRTTKLRFYNLWKRQTHYALNNVLNNVRKQPLAVFLIVMVIAVSLMLPTVCYLLWKNAHQAAEKWYPTPNLTIYLEKHINLATTQQLLDKLNEFDGIKNIEYLSKEETLAEFRQWSGFNDALNMLDNNPLPAVIIVFPTAEANLPGHLKALQKMIYKLPGVDDVRLDDGWFARLSALTGLVGSIAMIIAVLMILAVFLVIGNSIRLTILARRKTIDVMRLIGATDGFILRPFLYHGAILGFVSALLSILLSELFIWRIEYIVDHVSAVFGTVFSLQGLSIDEIILILLFATMMGWAAAWLTTMQFLKNEGAE